MPHFTAFDVSYIALWIVVVFQTFVILELVHRVMTGQLTFSGSTRGQKGELLVTGSMAPRIELTRLSDGRRVNSDSWRGQSTMLVFVSPDCSVCRETAHELVSTHHRGDFRVIALCNGDRRACASFASTYLPDVPVLLDETSEVAMAYRIKGTPTAVLLDKAGRIFRYGFPRPTARLDFSTDENAREEPRKAAAIQSS